MSTQTDTERISSIADIAARAIENAKAAVALTNTIMAEREEVKARARKAAQTLIAAIGSAGPENVEDAAERAVAKIAALQAENSNLRDIIDKCAGACE